MDDENIRGCRGNMQIMRRLVGPQSLIRPEGEVPCLYPYLARKYPELVHCQK